MAAATSQPDRWYRRANTTAGGRTYLVGNFAVGGQTTAYVLETELPLLLAAEPEIVITGGGVNDITFGVTAAAIIANYQAIYSQLVDAGITFFAPVLTPGINFDTDPEKTAWDTVQAWIRTEAVNHGATAVIDWDSAIREPGTYLWKTGLDSDGVHPSTAGHTAMAGVLADVFTAHLPEV